LLLTSWGLRLLCRHCGVLLLLLLLLLLRRSRHLAVVTYAAADGSSSGQVQQVSAAAELGSTAAISGSSVAVLSEDGQQLCVLPSPGAQGWFEVTGEPTAALHGVCSRWLCFQWTLK
jgi:hypothetical protein